MRGEFLDIGGRRIYYYAAGTRGTGVPVVLLHGFPHSSRLWHPVVRSFPAGHRLVVCDLPGFGRSDPPPPGSAFSAAGHADAILGLLDNLQIQRACIVGHGTGAGVALKMALKAGNRISHLVLAASERAETIPRGMARLAGTLPAPTWFPPGFLAGLVHGSAIRGFSDPDRNRLSLDTSLRPFTTKAGRQTLISHLRAARKTPTTDAENLALQITQPTAVICGELDPFVSIKRVRLLSDAIPSATLHVLSRASHFTPEEAPDAFVKIIVELLSKD